MNTTEEDLKHSIQACTDYCKDCIISRLHCPCKYKVTIDAGRINVVPGCKCRGANMTIANLRSFFIDYITYSRFNEKLKPLITDTFLNQLLNVAYHIRERSLLHSLCLYTAFCTTPAELEFGKFLELVQSYYPNFKFCIMRPSPPPRPSLTYGEVARKKRL